MFWLFSLTLVGLAGNAYAAKNIATCSPAPPYTPNGWTVQYHIAHCQGVDIEKIALWQSNNQMSGKTVRGTEIRKQLVNKKIQVLNADVLDFLLSNPELIPESWKNKSVYFWGTIYEDSSSGHKYVRCLYWHASGHWYWYANGLSELWTVTDSAAVLK
jgi:hypothetical protein